METTDVAPVLEQSDAVTQIAHTLTPTENIVYVGVIMIAGYATGKVVEKGVVVFKKVLAKRQNQKPTQVSNIAK